MEEQVKEIACNSAREFVKELDPSSERWAEDRWRNWWIFRGQADTNWRLVPSSLRTDSEGVSDQMKIARSQRPGFIEDVIECLQSYITRVSEFSHESIQIVLTQLFAEIRNLREFFELADSLNLNDSLLMPTQFHTFGTKLARKYVGILKNEEEVYRFWNKESVALASIAIAQHHGVSTRLLDWTKNPLFAAFFATQGISRNATHIAVYAIHSFYLKHDVRLVEVNKGYSTYIHSQEGVFTLDCRADVEFLKTGVWRSLIDANVGDVYKITLPVSELAELSRILWLKRVTIAHMMPTLDNVITALNAKWTWQSEKSAEDS
ncbi:MAG: FRG domain-containing protein [Anaerolineae bacterium]|nr:FRG domain-containing protein [Anaerolineae bacterium]